MAEEINNSETSELEKIFSQAANHLQSLASNLDSEKLLDFYGLYKQATIGVCNIPKPSWYQTQAKYKWEAWKCLGDMSKENAMNQYIKNITKIDPDWQSDEKIRSNSWVVVSTLPSTDSLIRDIDKILLDWVKEGNEAQVKKTLLLDPSSLNSVDEDGMSPLHWAADRGHLSTIKCLIENGGHLDAQDNDGQTALHYAASCGHRETVEYLLSVGAKLLKDNDDMTPADVADKNIKAMF